VRGRGWKGVREQQSGGGGARGERERGGSGAGGEGGAWEVWGQRASPTCYRPLAPSPLPPPRRGQGGGRARWAHRIVSAVRVPSCVGMLPLSMFS
jgi:hypothetical protein